MKRIIYADNAATTKLDREAFDCMVPWLTDEYGNPSQPYFFARKPKKAIVEAKSIIASCINASPEEIYITSGGTESDNWAIKGSVLSNARKTEMITSLIEHHAVLNACKTVERFGHHVIYIPPNFDGVISPKILEKSITNHTRLVSIMFSNNEIGTIEPIKELARIAHNYGAVFHSDAVQAVGHVNIDVKDLDIDMLSASAHKFNGPKGIGFLYVKKGTPLMPFNDGGSQEQGLRAGTENVASIIGMATALKNNLNNLNKNTTKILNLEKLLLENLSGIDFIRNGAKKHVPGNLSLSFPGQDGEAILHRLDLSGICVSTGSACDSVNTQISHVLKAIKLDETYAKGTIRISLGKENTVDDVLTIAQTLKKICG